MEGESGVTRSIFDELNSSDIQGDQMECEGRVFDVSLMNFIVPISNEIKCKVKGVLLEISLIKLFFGISKKIKLKVKVVLLEV